MNDIQLFFTTTFQFLVDFWNAVTQYWFICAFIILSLGHFLVDNMKSNFDPDNDPNLKKKRYIK